LSFKIVVSEQYLDGRGRMDSYSPIRSRAGFMGMTEGSKLTIFTYKWGKCVRIVEKSPLESLI